MREQVGSNTPKAPSSVGDPDSPASGLVTPPLSDSSAGEDEDDENVMVKVGKGTAPGTPVPGQKGMVLGQRLSGLGGGRTKEKDPVRGDDITLYRQPNGAAALTTVTHPPDALSSEGVLAAGCEGSCAVRPRLQAVAQVVDAQLRCVGRAPRCCSSWTSTHGSVVPAEPSAGLAPYIRPGRSERESTENRRRHARLLRSVRQIPAHLVVASSAHTKQHGATMVQGRVEEGLEVDLPHHAETVRPECRARGRSPPSGRRLASEQRDAYAQRPAFVRRYGIWRGCKVACGGRGVNDTFGAQDRCEGELQGARREEEQDEEEDGRGDGREG